MKNEKDAWNQAWLKERAKMVETVAAVESGEFCEVCGKAGKSADRCKFGHRSGLCSCWDGVPCEGKKRFLDVRK